MPIKNYGLGWSWDKSFSSNCMFGRKGRQAPINFYWQFGVYTLEKKGKIVYVGKGCGEKNAMGWRISDHVDKKKGQWDTFSWFGFIGVEHIEPVTGALLNIPDIDMKASAGVEDVEALLIYLLKPKLNLVRGKHKHITEYVQYWHPAD